MVTKTFGEHFDGAKIKMRQWLRWLAIGAIILNWIYLILVT
jgi:hypothetical protein